MNAYFLERRAEARRLERLRAVSAAGEQRLSLYTVLILPSLPRVRVLRNLEFPLRFLA